MSHDHDAEDLATAEEIKAHHAVMIHDLDHLASSLDTAARSGDGFDDARSKLHEWVGAVLVPHAVEEEQMTYRAASELAEGAPLIESMLSEHELIRATAKRVDSADDPRESAAYARMLFEIFHSHQRKEDDIIVPMLLKADGVSLSDLVGDATAHDHHHHH
ncbi:MAG: hemerythrin domain-containing protein [Microthrixaceae bacterium]